MYLWLPLAGVGGGGYSYKNISVKLGTKTWKILSLNSLQENLTYLYFFIKRLGWAGLYIFFYFLKKPPLSP